MSVPASIPAYLIPGRKPNEDPRYKPTIDNTSVPNNVSRYGLNISTPSNPNAIAIKKVLKLPAILTISNVLVSSINTIRSSGLNLRDSIVIFIPKIVIIAYDITTNSPGIHSERRFPKKIATAKIKDFMIASAKGNRTGNDSPVFLWRAPLYHDVEKLSVTRAMIIITRSIGTFLIFITTKILKKD